MQKSNLNFSCSRKPRKCPNCGTAPVASILYGMPSISDELFEKEQLGEVIFGGCVIEPDQPTWQCSKCGAAFYKKEVPDISEQRR